MVSIKHFIKNAYFWVGFILVVIVGVSIVLTLYSNDTNDWIGYWGNIMGGAIGGAVTLLGIRISFDQQRKTEYNRLLRYWEELDTALSRAIDRLESIDNLYDRNKGKFKELVLDRFSESNKECFGMLEEYGEILKSIDPFYYRRFVMVFNYLNQHYNSMRSIFDLPDGHRPADSQTLERIKSVITNINKDRNDIYQMIVRERV